jgi:hypothetical protein
VEGSDAACGAFPSVAAALTETHGTEIWGAGSRWDIEGSVHMY